MTALGRFNVQNLACRATGRVAAFLDTGRAIAVSGEQGSPYVDKDPPYSLFKLTNIFIPGNLYLVEPHHAL